MMTSFKKNKLLKILSLFWTIVVIVAIKLVFIKSIYLKHEDSDPTIRDLKRYKCDSMTRYGSNTNSDPLYRIDGDYFVCNDTNYALVNSNCIVLSFGVNRNDKFEENIHERLNCIVHSFDPIFEPVRVTLIRNSFNSEFKNSTTVRIKDGWYFHALGLSSEKKAKKINNLWFDSYERILEYVNLRGKVIDVLKLDAEGAEWELIEDLMVTKHSNTLCKFVKQLVFEAHPWLNTHDYNYRLVKSLEVCFRLFRRDHRFFVELEKTEWQVDEFRLDLKLFKDETDLARFLFTYGELYFVNVNFLSNSLKL